MPNRADEVHRERSNDNIKYTKKEWINRNRLLHNGADSVFTVPLRRDSDFLDVKDRAVAGDFDRGKLANQLREAYWRQSRIMLRSASIGVSRACS
jgi:WbqC-like protein family